MNTITDERKQILKELLFTNGATKKMLSEIDDLQELIFLIASLNECERNVGFNIDDSRDLIYKSVVSKLSNLPEYFMISDNNTGGFLINNNYADIFSQREFAEDAVKHYSDMGVNCSLFKVESNNTGLPKNIDLFTYLYYLGIKYLMVDGNRYGIAVKRNEILPKSQIKKKNIFNSEVENPDLRFAVANFYSSMKNKNAFSVSKERLRNLENIMIYETANAKYFVPVKYKGEKPQDDNFKNNRHLFTMAKTVTENYGELLTVFTDKMEFEKAYPNGDWNYIILDFNTVSSIGNCNGIMINVSSERLSIDRKTIAFIRETAKKLVVK